MTTASIPARMGMRMDRLTPFSPWPAPQLSATKAPRCSLPDATCASVALVQAICVGMRTGGCGSPAGASSAVMPIARQWRSSIEDGTVLLVSRQHDETQDERNAD